MSADESVHDERLELELKCCCCGRLMDTHLTPWSFEYVQPQTMWTMQPCESCEDELAREKLQRS